MDDYSHWRSLRELDEAAGLPKGSSFRAFKRLLSNLSEGRDFIVLDHQTHSELASFLHAGQRLYRSSMHPVLLSADAAARVAAVLNESPNSP